MSMSDPIADMLSRIRNAQAVRKVSVSMPASKVKAAIAEVLKGEGYILNFEEAKESGKPQLRIDLKYKGGKPVIDLLQRVSRPGLRRYCGKNELPKIRGGFGVAILSTSKGLMTDVKARAAGYGGEVLCIVA